MHTDDEQTDNNQEGQTSSSLALLLRSAKPLQAYFKDGRTPGELAQIMNLVEQEMASLADEGIAPASLLKLKDNAIRMAVDGHRERDPIREIQSVLGERWSPLVLDILHVDSFRFTTLHKLMTAMSSEKKLSPKVLTEALRDLERDGLVERIPVGDSKNRVMYQLTSFGHGLVEHVNQLRQWVRANSPAIQSAAIRFQNKSDE